MNGQGATAEDAIADMKEALQEVIQSYRKSGKELPAELNGNIEFEYKYNSKRETFHLKKSKANWQRLGKAVKNINSKTDLVKPIPNDETIKAIDDAREKKGMKAENVDDLFDQL